MMKKITLLLFLLVASLGYSQTVLEDFEGTAPTIKITNDGNGSVAIVPDPESGGTRGNVLKLVTASGEKWTQAELFMQGDHIDLTAASTDREVTVDIYSVTPRTFMAKVVAGTGGDSAGNSKTAHTGSGWETITFDFTAGQDNTGAADGIYGQIYFFPFRDTPNSGWHDSENAEFYFDNITAIGFDTSNTDASLSDLKVDDVSITGFDSATETYTYAVPPGTTVVPTVTAVTTKGVANAVVTAAAGIPGSTTVVVTAGDNTTTKTYTIAFEFDKAPTTAPTAPPARNAWDVVSLYSDEYTQTAITNFDAGWCGNNSIEEITVANNNILAFKNNNCQGIELAAVDVTAFTHLHVDVYIEGSVDVTSKVFNLKFVDTADNQFKEVNFNAGSSPALAAGQWISIDVAVDLSDYDKWNQFGITADNLKNEVWFDNLYVYRAATASVQNNALLGFSMYPNPASNQLNISAKETIQNADIFNVLGKKVMSVNINKTSESIDVSSLTSGIYLVKYNVNGTVGTAKFIKQ